MKNKDIIPLTEKLILERSQDLYYICGSIRHLTPYVDITMQPNNCTASWTLTTKRRSIIECREKLGVNSKSYNAFLETMPEYLKDNFIVMMPFDVWDLLVHYMEELTTVEKKTVTRVFLYLYYYAMRHYGKYARAREKVIEILHINKDTFTHTVQWLESKALIERGDYLKKVTARSYTIPAVLWTEECVRDVSMENK